MKLEKQVVSYKTRSNNTKLGEFIPSEEEEEEA